MYGLKIHVSSNIYIAKHILSLFPQTHTYIYILFSLIWDEGIPGLRLSAPQAFTNAHAVKAYREVEVWLHSFLTSALDGG